ncbi:proline-rich protein 12 [Plakobranchus ocellatus]|uniref:Proline-rich protein 12 n=1 Tax=Plakobranchus ocellatus TaxID=259542 RepID=A0AAV4CPP0_9GAST|nr:proline-rich protein 12 [Plakobranchus ocellatus]
MSNSVIILAAVSPLLLVISPDKYAKMVIFATVQEIVVGATTEKILVPYHGLSHFKVHLLKRCRDKTKLVQELQDADVSVDKLLEDRAWILQAFGDFVNLLNT